MISIIIPVYNSERYLNRCIESILSQTYSDIELLLVNDGSSDKSGFICDNYATLDKRVKTFHTKNRGVSSARNLGLECAQGDFVAFYDSDDFLKDVDSLELLYHSAIQYNADIVKGDYSTFDNTGYWSYPKQKAIYFANKQLSSIEFISNVLNGEFFLWTLLIKRSVIGNIRFIEGRSYLEDMEFLCQVMQKIKTAIYIPIRHYVYRKHSNAISFTPNPQKISDVLAVMYSLLRFADANSQLKTVYINQGVHLYISSLRLIAIGGFWKRRREIILQLKMDKHRQEIVDVLKINNLPINIIYRCSPNTAVILLSLEDMVKATLYRFSYKIKLILGVYKS